MNYLSGILAFITGAAGWHYLFYSPAAVKLQDLENQAINARRGILRRCNGGIMLVLAVMFCIGYYSVDDKASPLTFVLVWIGVMSLLAAVIILALLDLSMTGRLRRRK